MVAGALPPRATRFALHQYPIPGCAMDVASLAAWGGAEWVSAAWTLALGAVLLAWLGIALRLWQAQRNIPTLAPPEGPPPERAPDGTPAGAPWPLLSVIVPARNEAAHVESCLRSLLAQDYPRLEILAVDDRSQDGTGALLDALAAEAGSAPGAAGRLTVLHVAALPAGWLGKNHANRLAAQRARGELLLFTDADVRFAPGALRAAVAHLLRHRLEHLVLAPRLLASGYWERAILATFALYFVLRLRLWALHRARSAAYVGVGAFNLVRRGAYAACGGHERLRLEVVDDLKLGLLLRRSGARQGLAAGRDLLSVRWQAGFWASLRGLLKNAFADCEYRWAPVLGSAAGLLALGWLPWAGLLWAPAGGLCGLALAGALVPVALLGAGARRSAAGNGLEGLAAPLTHGAFAAVLLLSAALATLRGGLTWRDTFYSLRELRAGTLRERDLPCDAAVGE